MSLISFLFALRYGLPKAENRVRSTLAIDVIMPDGVALKTDHYAPQGEGPYPTLMMRLPYGRQNFSAIAQAYAERGFHVVAQACRGTDGSGGEFQPLQNERADGLATLEWLKAQTWFDGRLGLTGPSYLGYCQWAIADAPEVKALSAKATSAEFRSVMFPSGADHLGLWLSWLQTIEGLRTNQLRTARYMVTGGVERRTQNASVTVPLIEADRRLMGHVVPFWRNWFAQAVVDGAFWEGIDHRSRLTASTPPNHFISGWYDFMIDQLLNDYRQLLDAGQRPYLTIANSTHVTGGNEADHPLETLQWMRAQLLNDRNGLRDKPVRFEIGGERRWVECEVFPPSGASEQSLYLQQDRGLASTTSAETSASSTYGYDPLDPTPNVGGAMFAFVGAGPVDNAPRERRADVLTFTGEPLGEALTIIGRARFILFARADNPHVDFFVRLCDVNARGQSSNVCDGLVRMYPDSRKEADGLWRIEIQLNATAYTFRDGHKLRLQVSSGAHPRYARNSGTSVPIGDATHFEPANVEVFHDSEHPSHLILPTYRADAL